MLTQAQRFGGSYYRARYYDPTTGRFTSEDPIQFQGGANFYRYVRNRPTQLKDPRGNNPGAIAIEGAGGLLCFGSGACETVMTVVAVTAAVVGTGAVIYELLKKSPPPVCKKGQVDCWYSGEFQDPEVSNWKICSYSCSDGQGRTVPVPVGTPCPARQVGW